MAEPRVSAALEISFLVSGLFPPLFQFRPSLHSVGKTATSPCVVRGKNPSAWRGLGHTAISAKGVGVESAPPRAQHLRRMRNGSQREIQVHLPGKEKMKGGRCKQPVFTRSLKRFPSGFHLFPRGPSCLHPAVTLSSQNTPCDLLLCYL